MARQHDDIVAQRIELFFYSLKEQIAIATRQIPATNSARKQNVAADQQFVFSRKETQAARAMTRHFQDFHLQSEKIADRRGSDQEIGLDRFDLQLKPQAAKEFRIGNHRSRLRMTANGTTELLPDLRDVRDVIEMAVSQQKEFRRQAFGDQPIASAVWRVKENGAFRRFDQITVRLEDSAAKGLVTHRRRL